MPISANQVEYNVHHNREELLGHCNTHRIHLTAHRPLAKGTIRGKRILNEIGQKHDKTAAQVAMSWLLQKGLSVIPKSSSEAHRREHLPLFDWKLTSSEMEQINNLNE